jgi:hypothetical protein
VSRGWGESQRPSPDGRTPLHFAATRDNPAIVTALITGGTRTTTQSAEGLTPLCAAAKDGQSVPVVQALIDGGASVDGICRMQWGPNPIGPNATALCIASAWNSPEIVRTFLDAGASVELVCSRPGDVSNIEGPVSALAWAEYSLYTGKLRGDHAEGQAAAQAVLDMLIAAGAKRRDAAWRSSADLLAVDAGSKRGAFDFQMGAHLRRGLLPESEEALEPVGVHIGFPATRLTPALEALGSQCASKVAP